MARKASAYSLALASLWITSVEGNNGLEEIVVTATHKPSSAMSTPVALSAIDNEALESQGITEISDLSYAIPGLSFVNAGMSNNRIAIRGIQSVGEPTAGLYYNQVPVSGVVGATNDSGGTLPGLRLIDVDRVEVLRGPQGTLYGAGAMTGALKVHFNRPTYEQESTVKIAISDTHDGENNYEYSLVNNTPLFDNRLLTRLVIYGEDNGGYIDNIPLDEDNINDSETQGARLSLSSNITESLNITAEWFYQKHEGDRPLWHLEDGDYNSVNELHIENMDRLEVGTLSFNYLFEDAELSAIFGHQARDADQVSVDLSRFYSSFLNNALVCQDLFSLPNPCGQPELNLFNGFVSGFIPSALTPQQSSQENSFELRYTTNRDDTTNVTAGIYYAKRTGDVENLQLLADSESGNFIVPSVIQYRRLIDEGLKQTAAFAELTHPITSDTNITIGTRYFDYTRSTAGETPLGLDALRSPTAAYESYESKESGWISKVLIDTQLSQNIFSYFSIAEGYRPGGVNQVIGLSSDLQSYKADELLNYELGFKSKWLEESIFANLNFYRAEWDDIQIRGRSGAFRFTANAGEAVVDGAELEITTKLSDRLNIGGNLSWTDARLIEDQGSDGFITPGEDGNAVPHSHDLTGSVYIDYKFWRSNSLTLTSFLNYSYVGGTQSEFNPDDVNYQRIDSYELINLRLLAEHTNGISGVLFINNLTNETAVTYAQRDTLSAGKTWATSISPRTIGASVAMTFN